MQNTLTITANTAYEFFDKLTKSLPIYSGNVNEIQLNTWQDATDDIKLEYSAYSDDDPNSWQFTWTYPTTPTNPARSKRLGLGIRFKRGEYVVGSVRTGVDDQVNFRGQGGDIGFYKSVVRNDSGFQIHSEDIDSIPEVENVQNWGDSISEFCDFRDIDMDTMRQLRIVSANIVMELHFDPQGNQFSAKLFFQLNVIPRQVARGEEWYDFSSLALETWFSQLETVLEDDLGDNSLWDDFRVSIPYYWDSDSPEGQESLPDFDRLLLPDDQIGYYWPELGDDISRAFNIIPSRYRIPMASDRIITSSTYNKGGSPSEQPILRNDDRIVIHNPAGDSISFGTVAMLVKEGTIEKVH